MARLNLDEPARTDPRITRMAAELGEPRQHTMGRLLDVWWLCYDRRTPELPVEDVNDSAGREDFAAAMVRRRLATQLTDSLVCIAGAAGRIGYLTGQKERAQAGGAKRASTAARGADGRLLPAGHQPTSSQTAGSDQPDGKTRPAEVQPATSYSSSSSSSSSSSPREEYEPSAPPPLKLIPEARRPERQEAPEKPAVPGYRETIALFTERYRQQTGSAPTWGAKQGGQVKQLLAAHGAAEVQARIGRLFDGAIAAWCRAPYDVGTLVQHFDKLAAVASAPRPVVPHGDPERRSRAL